LVARCDLDEAEIRAARGRPRQPHMAVAALQQQVLGRTIGARSIEILDASGAAVL
jgi:hypothetical protein